MNGMDKNTRHQVMLQLYVEDRKTLQEIGDLFSISRERVRQILSQYPTYEAFRTHRERMNKDNRKLHKSLKDYRDNDKITELFWSYVASPSEGNCMLWQGSIHNATGFPRFNSHILARAYGHNSYYAHRFMWCMYHNDTIPADKFVHHSCENKHCVNPEHLYLTNSQWR